MTAIKVIGTHYVEKHSLGEDEDGKLARHIVGVFPELDLPFATN